MKLIVTALIVLFTSISLIAKDAPKEVDAQFNLETSILSGKVMDKDTGEELVGVAVKIEGIDQLVYSDFEGNFKFSKVLPGNYKLHIEMISYNEIETLPIVVLSNEVHELNIGLEQKK